jgi:hypothetical protein
MSDLDIVEDVCNQIFGRSFCAFGDGAAQPPLTAIRHFRDEWVAHVEEQRCPLGATPPADLPTLVAHAVDEDGRIEPPRGPGLPLYRAGAGSS